jgi:SET domain-containing protein
MGAFNSYLSPQLDIRSKPEVGGKGVYARSAIAPGELLAVWGGDVIGYQELSSLSEADQKMTAQVEEGLYLFSTRPGAGDYINHSCDPNAGLRGQIALVAMRSIAAGEEVTIDYAMCDGTAYDEFECACGAQNCRGSITGNDWQIEELWERYAGYFSPYLQQRIDKLQTADPAA